RAMWNLEQTLEETEEYDNTSIRDHRLVVNMHKPKGRFKGLQISANENEVSTELPEKDREIQTYITLVGCSLSLFALVITVLLFITIRCYINNDTVKMVTTVGLFCLVFIFNIIMLGVTVRRIVGLRRSKEYGQSDCDRAKKDICTLLGVTVLLGITWGLVFFTFGYLTIPGLYLFCILNSLQGFFIFLWFVMSLRKKENSSSKTSSDARSTNS
ncbi:Adhesion G-protein coupled receptor G2, partial [Nibea albiflora]